MARNLALLVAIAALSASTGSALAAPPPPEWHVKSATALIHDDAGSALRSDGRGTYASSSDAIVYGLDFVAADRSDLLRLFPWKRSFTLTVPLADDPATAAPEAGFSVACDGYSRFDFWSVSSPDWYGSSASFPAAPMTGRAYIRCAPGNGSSPVYHAYFPANASPAEEECVTLSRGSDTAAGDRAYTVRASGCPATFWYTPSKPHSPSQTIITAPAALHLGFEVD